MIQDWDFDQGEVLEEKGKAHWPGICLSLAYDWCKRVLSGSHPMLPQYANITPERAMSQQRAYRDTTQSTDDWIVMLATADRLTVTSVEVQGFQGLNGPINQVPSGRACIVGIPGHAVALCKMPARTLFFDPNYGQYRAMHSGMGFQVVDFLAEHYAEDRNGGCELHTLSGQPRDRAYYSG
jgi:hypothetical protein